MMPSTWSPRAFIVPLMEKMMAEGAIVEYDLDTQAIHTDAPGTFHLYYTAPNAEGLDKVNQALQEMMKANPLDGPAFGSMVDSHRPSRLSLPDQRHFQIASTVKRK